MIPLEIFFKNCFIEFWSEMSRNVCTLDVIGFNSFAKTKTVASLVMVTLSTLHDKAVL